MTDDKMRAEFEEWARSTFNWHTWEQVAPEEPKTISSWDGEKYCHRVVNGMWLAWQASRASLCVELPAPVPDYAFGDDPQSEAWSIGYNLALRHCAAALDKAGVKYR